MYRVALVGCGRIAQRHAKLLGTGQIDGAELVAVCDIVPEKAHTLSQEYNVTPYVGMCNMMQDYEPDIVSVLTPSGEHAKHIKHLAQYGAHIIVEKPLALTLSSVDDCIKACESAGVQLCEVKQNRYNVAVQHLRRAIDAGKLGKLNFGSVRVWWHRDREYYQDWHGTWAQAGGVLANQAIHHIDLLQWIMGPVRQVSAFAKYTEGIEVETGLVGILKFESGALGTVEVTTLANRNLEGSLAILGEKGTIEVGGFAANSIKTWTIVDPRHQEDEWRKLFGTENPPDVYGFGHKKFYEDVIAKLDAGEPLPVPGPAARKSIEIVTAMYESMECGRASLIFKKDYSYFHSRLGK